jgi:low affinity Fe/Cu permease
MNEFFRRFSRSASELLGTPWAFVVAVAIIIIWAVSGPAAQFSATWQLLINTGTTIITFLMVFIIQNTQNHDNAALHAKLNELIHALDNARNELIDIEDATEDELRRRQEEFAASREPGSAAEMTPPSAAAAGR